jgi:DNA-binding NarL/FixJ family response regulator
MSSKVLVVDDHEAARLGISILLRDAGFEVVALTAGSVNLELMSAAGYDAVLLDVRMPDRDGLSLLEAIRELYGSLPVVILSAYDNVTYVARAAALGDYVIKGSSRGNVESCLHRALRHEEPTPASPLAKVRRMLRDEIDVSRFPESFPLTGREAQVLRHVALGLSNKEIARSLAISIETVKEHVQNILRKVKAHDRTDAAVRAIRSGIFDN